MRVDAPKPRPGLRERLLSGGLWTLAGKALGGVVVVATNALLARILSPAEFGEYFLALSLVTICATVAPLGANRAVVRFIAQFVGLNQPGAARAAVRQAIYLGIGGSLIMAAMILSGLGTWLLHGVVGSEALRDSIDLIALWIVPLAMTLLVAEICRGFHDMQGAVTHGGLSVGLLTVMMLGLLYAFGMRLDLRGVLIVSLVASVAGLSLAAFAVRRHVQDLPERAEVPFSFILKVALPLLVTNAMILALAQADIWLLGAYRTSQEVAIYSAAAKLMFIVSVPLNIVVAIIQPLVAEYYSQGRKAELQRLLRVAATLAAVPGFAALVAAIVFAGLGLKLLYGEVYAAGADVLVVLALGQLVYVWTGASAIVLMMTGHERSLMLLLGLTGAITVALMKALVHSYGMLGVAVGSAIGVALQNVVLWLAARRLAGVWTNVGFYGLGEVRTMLRTEIARRGGGVAQSLR